VVTVGNHEVDYGLSHLLFLEKCANFPVVSANMYVKLNESRLFSPDIVLKAGGIKILFIGAITEDVVSNTNTDPLIGKLIDIKDVAEEVRKRTDAYRTSGIDLTVLLTHIGFEADMKLAEELGPDSDVDIIIGGHSHTYLEEPCVVAGIPIVQAAVGTDQIGRFDIVFDSFTKQIDSYTWELIPITEDNCPRDTALEEVIEKYKKVTDAKYLRALTRFAREYTHVRTGCETELGDLIAGVMRTQLGSDLVLIGSGSIRGESLGPIVTLQDFMEAFPYESSMISFDASGDLLKKIVMYLLRDDALDEDVWTEWFQFSNGFYCEYDHGRHEILKLTIDGKDVQDDETYSIAVQSFFFCSKEDYFGITDEDVNEKGEPKELASSMQNVLQEYFDGHDYIKLEEEKRLVIR
jgi:5'-nucleotidase